MNDKMEIVNPEDVHIWNKLFKVSLAAIVTPAYVFADCGSEAIDTYADHAEEKGWQGLFMDEQDVLDDYTNENNEEVDIVRVGNHCRPVFSGEIYCREVTGWEKTRIKKEADGYGY